MMRSLHSTQIRALVVLSIYAPVVLCPLHAQQEGVDVMLARAFDAVVAEAYAQAIEYCDKVLSSQANEEQKAEAHLLRGTSYLHRGETSRAEQDLKQAVEVLKRTRGEKHPSYITALHNLAVLYQRTARYTDAETAFKQIVAIYEKALGEDDPETSWALNNLANLYAVAGRYAEAEPLFRRAAEVLKKAGERETLRYAAVLRNLANTYYDAARYAEAEPLYKQVVEICRKALGEDHPDYSVVLKDQADVLFARGRYAEAERLYEEALKIQRKALGEKHPLYGYTLVALARVFYQTGRYADAERSYQQALDTLTGALGKQHQMVAGVMNDMALLYVATRQYSEAERLYKQVLEQQPRSDAALNGLAMVYYHTGRYDEAQQLYRQALETARKALGEEHTDVAIILNNLALVYAVSERYAEAEQVFEQALDIVRKVLGEEHPHYAVTLNNLAMVQAKAGRYSQAERSLQRVIEIQRKTLGEKHPAYAQSLRNIANLYDVQKRFEAAYELLQQSLRVHQQHLSRLFVGSSEQTMLSASTDMRETVHYLLHHLLVRGASTGELRKDGAAWALRVQGMVLDAICRLRLAAQEASASEETRILWSQLQSVRQRLNDLQLNPPAGWNSSVLQEQTRNLLNRAQQLEANLSGRLGEKLGSSQLARAVDWSAMQNRLGRGGVLIWYVWLPPRKINPAASSKAHYVALVFRGSDGEVFLLDLGEAEQIDTQVQEFRQLIGGYDERFGDEAAAEQEVKRAGTDLFRVLLQPVLKTAGEAVQRLWIGTDGGLSHLPFEALVQADGSYLLERYEVVYATALSDILGRGQTAQGSGALVIANPDYNMEKSGRKEALARLRAGKPHVVDLASARAEMEQTAQLRGVQEGLRSGFSHLPGAEREGERVRDLLSAGGYSPVRLLLGGEGLEEVLKEMETSPRVLHIATHGFYAPQEQEGGAEQPFRRGLGGVSRLRQISNPLLRSGLVLAGANRFNESLEGMEDGWLTAEEAAFLRLRGTELVALSACETGLGDVGTTGEGILGLRRAFLYAGARRLLVSLFKVGDQASLELMSRFYSGFVTSKAALASWREAQLSIIRERRARGGASHPFYWSSFILIGEP